MPIYEYQCGSCQKTFEVWQKVSDPSPGKCEHCGSKKVSKILSQSAFHLKGSGWYITDYARKGKSDSSASSSEKKSDSSSSKKD